MPPTLPPPPTPGALRRPARPRRAHAAARGGHAPRRHPHRRLARVVTASRRGGSRERGVSTACACGPAAAPVTALGGCPSWVELRRQLRAPRAQGWVQAPSPSVCATSQLADRPPARWCCPACVWRLRFPPLARHHTLPCSPCTTTHDTRARARRAPLRARVRVRPRLAQHFGTSCSLRQRVCPGARAHRGVHAGPGRHPVVRSHLRCLPWGWARQAQPSSQACPPVPIVHRLWCLCKHLYLGQVATGCACSYSRPAGTRPAGCTRSIRSI